MAAWASMTHGLISFIHLPITLYTLATYIE